MSAAEGFQSATMPGRAADGLMSLLQMVNCNISALGALCSQLMLEQLARDESFGNLSVDFNVADDDKSKIFGWLDIAEFLATDFEWKAVHDRIKIIRRKLASAISNRTLAIELRVLRETINNGLEWQFLYRYPQDKSVMLRAWKEDWASALKSFPSAESDIFAGVDLWALGHSTASAFHFMRVLEHGLRALAREQGIVFDVQNWQSVIDEIESSIRRLGKSLPRGHAKADRLQFLSEAAKEFMYFKDGWRNHVAHNRAKYDEHQARSILEHVKAFMTVLSSRLSEEGPSAGESC